ncbi:MAG: hypothetical protein ACXWC4_00645 [Telluria sp.]
MNSDDQIRGVIASPETSFWLKHALAEALDRDCLDALRDAELLAHLLKGRFESLIGGQSHAKT